VNRVVADAEVAVSLLLSLPLLVVWGFALFDIVRRPDLARVRKAVWGAVVLLVFPATLLYLLARPTSLVRHRDRGSDDWRDRLVRRLESGPGPPPVLGPREEAELLARVRALPHAPS